jgi:Flp pilus assembly protein TadG
MIVKLIRDDTRGGTLVEFTVTIPLFLSLMFGLVQAGLLLFTSSGLQHGVERAARCASVNYSAKQLGLTQSCFAVAPTDVTNSTIQQYAAQSSWGLVPSSSSFTVLSPPNASANCGTDTNGNVVFGYVVSVSYAPTLIGYIFPSVTLNAKSCFPINIS